MTHRKLPNILYGISLILTILIPFLVLFDPQRTLCWIILASLLLVICLGIFFYLVDTKTDSKIAEQDKLRKKIKDHGKKELAKIKSIDSFTADFYDKYVFHLKVPTETELLIIESAIPEELVDAVLKSKFLPVQYLPELMQGIILFDQYQAAQTLVKKRSASS